MPLLFLLAPLGAALALVFAHVFYRGFMRTPEGDPAMVRVAEAVRRGAYAYLGKQARVVYLAVAALVVLLAVLAFLGLQRPLTPVGVGAAALLSGLCGFLGMKTATHASARTCHAAKASLDGGLRVAFRAGAVMGLCVTGFALLDVSLWFAVLWFLTDAGETPDGLVTLTTLTLTFAVGASLQALFARVGGGIYTKAADVGADLVGKVEAGIPEDDARNPATIADNVGDNVGDVAGMGADLYESYYGSILAAMALAAAAAFGLGLETADAVKLVVAAPALGGLGILCSIAAIYAVKAREGAGFAELLKSLHRGVYLSSIGIAALSAGLLFGLLGGIEGVSWHGIWIAILAGLLAGLVIAWGTERYTSYEHKPTVEIARKAETGPATVIISGVATGMMSTWVPLLTIVVAILVAFHAAGGGGTADGSFLLGVFGVGLAAVGMLSTLGITLATDAYGPIADNAGGNAEMTHQAPEVRERTDMLDSLGNTTAATGKGFAIGSAALTALALLAAYVITVQAQLTASVSPDAGIVAKLQNLPAEIVDLPQVKPVVEYQGGGRMAVYLGRDSFDAGLLQAGAGAAAVLDDLLDGRRQAAAKAGVPPLPLLLGGVWEGDAASGFRRFRLLDGAEGIPGVSGAVVPAQVATLPEVLAHFDVTLMNPRVLCGLFLGVMLVFVFCAMTMEAVGRAAKQMMEECRRQFAEMRSGFRAAGMSEAELADVTRWPEEVEVGGHRYPDYANCVAISTGGALREMVAPSLLAVAVPVATGLVLGVAAVMGLLTGTLVCGFAVAIFMANAGGAWDNAKKYIETGALGEGRGKGSDEHKAGVVGDTVGDPFKDTSGPSLNILIKLVSVVSVVFAAVVVRYAPVVGGWVGL
ncbi:sodium/proton-translocating pyrophosphatase [Phycisphaera mikurensis]|uniref:Putative K(+)-stimulated pyrophosphate-energized sodium pump n=1 Tax=Phycisphaera mikurensis (strain NBRC 102666 / KCTC 22515 / FYK2301M01) TaxID=1142394 RepID=I0IAT3_PHYMF|nr:sodium/proton-translocating pyrophosphatase [Phycisphaera mikurensis]MBB6442652.1 inorganic pyrophosphatase/K(+)-stimulated pyrophosphate-energized sodium pump [Phycisphaera mikurensis]BAM02371.1 putative K(+)-stimulated pyrophosphate-energized sodium pump [Phycisphaera mikurensis NBRC 102666]